MTPAPKPQVAPTVTYFPDGSMVNKDNVFAEADQPILNENDESEEGSRPAAEEEKQSACA